VLRGGRREFRKHFNEAGISNCPTGRKPTCPAEGLSPNLLDTGLNTQSGERDLPFRNDTKALTSAGRTHPHNPTLKKVPGIVHRGGEVKKSGKVVLLASLLVKLKK